MTRITRKILGRVLFATVVAGIAAVHVSASETPGARRGGALDGIPPSLDSVPHRPSRRDSTHRDSTWRDSTWRDSTYRDSLPDSSHHGKPRKPKPRPRLK